MAKTNIKRPARAVAGAAPPVATGAVLPGSTGLLISEITSITSHLSDVATQLEAVLQSEERADVQLAELSARLKSERESLRQAQLEVGELTAQLQTERDRRQRSENLLLQLRKAVETMQLGITITNREGKILYINPADAQMHGYTVDELIGKDVGVFAVGFQRQPMSQAKLRTVKSWQREAFNARKDGSVFKVRLLSDVVLDAEGEPTGVVTTCEEIREGDQPDRTASTATAVHSTTTG